MRSPEVATLVAGLLLAFRPLVAQCPNGSAPPCRWTQQAVPARNSVAVLYFDNASRDTADEYLADGLTEAVISQLGQVERISIASRFAVRRYRRTELPGLSTIGRTLGVAYLVTGSVQRAGHQLRVTTELARTATGVRVWGDQFVRSDDNLFGLQDDIARRVAEGVAGRLLPGERRGVSAVRTTRDPEAYEHFLRGNYYLAQRTSTGMMRATVEYRRAAELDSGFVSALARVGLAYALRLDWAWDPNGATPGDSLLERGMAAADQALRRDALNADAWLARGYLLQFRNPRTWEGVMAALERATTLDPRSAEAWQQWGDAALSIRDDSTAVVAIRRALAIDPARPVTLFDYAINLAAPAEAIPLLDSAIALDPSFLPASLVRVAFRFAQGDTATGRREAEAPACQACPPDMRPRLWAWHANNLGFVGDTAAARTEAKKVIAFFRPTGALSGPMVAFLADYFQSQGDSGSALGLLERIEPRGVTLWGILADPVFYPLSSNPRFHRILIDATPPWAPPEPAILDVPIPAAARARWTGPYTGSLGRRTVAERGDSLIVRDQYGELGRLLYQGGDTVIASWDHDVRIVFNTGGDQAPGFTVFRRKRVFPYKRE